MSKPWLGNGPAQPHHYTLTTEGELGELARAACACGWAGDTAYSLCGDGISRRHRDWLAHYRDATAPPALQPLATLY